MKFPSFKISLILILASLTLVQCTNATDNSAAENGTEDTLTTTVNDTQPTNEFVQRIEAAHNATKFRSNEAVSFNLQLTFGGNSRFDGNVILSPSMSKIKMTGTDSSTQIFDGEKMFASAMPADVNAARFNMFTWPYFFALPYKLSDEGARFAALGKKLFEGKGLETYKLTFDAGVGDSPDDWYIIYLNEDGTIHAAGYIVTFKKSKEEAEKNPHAIVYKNYKNIDDVPMATSWEFYNWNESTGITGEPIGKATLSDFAFPKVTEDFYSLPVNAVEVK